MNTRPASLNSLHDKLNAHHEMLKPRHRRFEDVTDVQELHALHHVFLNPVLVGLFDVRHQGAHFLEQDHHVRERGPHEIDRE